MRQWLHTLMGGLFFSALFLLWSCGSDDSSSKKDPMVPETNWRVWTRQVGTEGWFESGFDVMTDRIGNVYVTGVTAGGLEGNTHAGGSDIFVAKYDANGNQQWVRQLGTADSDLGWGVVVDDSGNLYVTGNTQGNFEGNTNQGEYDVVVAKYDTDGNRQWVQQFGSSAWDGAFDIDLDSAGNLYVTGMTGGSLGDNEHQGKQDIFLAKLNPEGVLQWVQQFGSSDSERGDGIFIDSADNIYITGVAGGALGENTHHGSFDAFLAKYNTSGTLQWVQQFGTLEWDEGENIMVNSEGMIFVSGSVSERFDGHDHLGGFDAFVAKFDAEGVLQQTIQFGTLGDDYGDSILVDASGNLYVLGSTSWYFEGQEGQGSDDMYLAKFDASGTQQWVKQFGTLDKDFPSAFVLSDAQSLYVTGNTLGVLDDGDPKEVESYEIVLLKINPTLIVP